MLKVARPSSLSAKLSNPQLNLTLVGVMVMMKIRHDQILKTPSKMDVAPWSVHWINMVLDGIEWY